MMKNKNLLIGLCSVLLLLSISINMTAQDSRERTYYYEILEPRHEPKPKIKGFATERVKENLDRGLTATSSVDGKGIYLSWRLLEQDKTDTPFHTVNNNQRRCRIHSADTTNAQSSVIFTGHCRT